MGHKRTLAVAVGAVILLQFMVPLGALVMPAKPNRLGWQMYSGVGEHEVVVRGATGEVLEVQWNDVLPRSQRPELDWTQRLPEHLCGVLDEPEVSVEFGTASRTVTC